MTADPPTGGPPIVDDAVLPAACHLTGEGARELLGTVAAATGSELTSWRTLQVQYRPGSDLTVRYAARLTPLDGSPANDESIVAATSSSGVHRRFPSALPLIATTPDGHGGEVELEVAVWRWPFDPELIGLTRAVTPRRVAGLLGTDPSGVALEALAYRPAERAVVRAVTPDGVRYLKVVRPSTAADLVRRHRALAEAGVPAPVVVAADEQAGIVALAELPGRSLRDELKQGLGPWPDAAEYLALTDAIGRVGRVEGLDTAGRPGLVRDGIGHTRLLRSIVPERARSLHELVAALQPAGERATARRGAIVHGDLYEAQLHIEGARIVGVLDVDDLGPGDPLDDPANVIAHLLYRAATAADHGQRERLHRYATVLRHDLGRSLSGRSIPTTELDLVIGAALLGLATGPFRVQHPDWPASVGRLVDTAAGLVLGADRPRSPR